jgi:hypothetical protein
MLREIYKPGEIITELLHAEVLTSQGESAIAAIRSIGMTDATYFFGEKLDY